MSDYKYFKQRGDPIRLEVVRNRFTAIANEMGLALQRSAYSTNIKTRRDFSCAVFDADGRAIAQSFAQPVHLGSLSHFVPKIIEVYGPQNLRPNDGILCNDGYRGGVHLNDVCLVSPVFCREEIVGYVANIAHHLDVGGSTPGSMMGYSTEIIHEGLRIPPIRLINQGQIDTNVFSLITNNVRSLQETSGDIRAQIAGMNIGLDRVKELFEKYGREEMIDLMSEILDYTEHRVCDEVSQIPLGIYEAEDFMDGDGNDNTPVKVSVKIEVSADGVIFDLSESDAQRQGPINATYAMTLSSCAYALRAMLSADLPSNEGFYRVCKVIAPEGLVVNAKFPAPIGGGWETGNRITETAFQAFSKVMPERMAAGSKGCFSNVAFGGISPRSDQYFMFYESICGGYGARASKDGIDGIQAHGQNTENSPIEETEANYPVQIVRYGLIPDSEGAGEYRGGLGVRRDYRFDHEITFSVLADRAIHLPWGLAGGLSARGTKVILNPDHDPEYLNSKSSVRLQAGDTISVQMGGGGGYGLPSARDPDAVLQDVRSERISPTRAKDVYGVAIDNKTYKIDSNSGEKK